MAMEDDTGRGGLAGADDPGVISTERLDLLPLRVEHAAEMAVVLSDPELHVFIGGAPAAPEALRSRYERLVAGAPEPTVVWWNWVVRFREEGRLVGTVQATLATEARRPVAEVAWVVGTPWQGRGIAKEAAGGLVRRLGQLPRTTVVAHIHPDHLASAAVATAVGLAPTPHLRDGEVRWCRRPDGGDAVPSPPPIPQ